MEGWDTLLSLQIKVCWKCQGPDLCNKPSIGHFTEFYFEPGQVPSLFLDIPHCVDFRTGQPTLENKNPFGYQYDRAAVDHTII